MDTFKFVDVHLSETISIADKVETNVIKFRTLTEGPIVVSGASGISHLASGSFQVTTINGNVTAGTVNITNNYQTNTSIESNTTINNLQDIFTQIDKSGFPPQKREEIKGTLTKIYDLVTTAGVGLQPWFQLLGSLIPK